MRNKEIRLKLLHWYDQNKRELPWRYNAGFAPSPYQVWLSEIMLQQTVVKAVIPYYIKFVEKWPTIFDLSQAREDEVLESWAGLGYYSRARNLFKCAKILVEEYDGVFPQSQSELKKLPGIGEYTSAAIRSIAFNKQAVVIDGNVERVVSRIFKIEEPLPYSKKQIFKHAEELSLSIDSKHSCFAQSLMDLGALVCIPKSPRCHICPVYEFCISRQSNMQNELPKKVDKKKQVHKAGYIYAIHNENNEILCEKRNNSNLFNKMIGLPTSEWVSDINALKHSKTLDKTIKLNNLEPFCEINHVFTHFKLNLKGFHISVRNKDIELSEDQFWINVDELTNLGLPKLFKKFVTQIVHNKIER